MPPYTQLLARRWSPGRSRASNAQAVAPIPLASTQPCLRALHQRQAPLHDFGVRRVAVAGIAQAVRRPDFLDEIHRLDERLHDGRIRLAVRRPAGDGECGQTQAAWRSRHGRVVR